MDINIEEALRQLTHRNDNELRRISISVTHASHKVESCLIADFRLSSLVMRTLYTVAMLLALIASTFSAEKGGSCLVIDYRLPLAGKNFCIVVSS